MLTTDAQTPDTAQISVIVPTFRRLDILQRCLAAIEASARSFSQIIVVTRPLEDPETFQWLSEQIGKIDGFEIIKAQEAGVVCALNVGLAHATGDFIAIFDDDALPHADWLDRVLAHFSDPQVACVGGRDNVYQNGRVITGKTTTPGQRNAFGIMRGEHHLAEGAARRVDSIKGCNWILRATAIGTVRLDDRLYGKGAQVANETWYCENLTHAGWSIIFDPSAQVDHFPAERVDGARDVYSRIRCHDQTANTVATDLAFASAWTRSKYIWYFIVKGHRYCPGLYYIAHALVKRPKSLPNMLIGGWSGFFDGLALARRFRSDPCGHAAPAPQDPVT